MRTNNYRKKKDSKIRQIRKDKGKLSDNTVDNKKAYRAKLMARKLERRHNKKAMKAEKMDTN